MYFGSSYISNQYRPVSTIRRSSLKLKLIGVLLLLLVSNPANAEAVFIHNPDLQGEDFSTDSLLHIYAMHKKLWSDGTPVRVFSLPTNSVTHREFVNKYLHMQPFQLNRLWHRLVFSGTGSAPKQVASDAQMLEIVKTTPGAVGYVDSSFLNEIDQSMMTGVSHD
jgi:ABC-type phosphate transport system substrate-binding protein